MTIRKQSESCEATIERLSTYVGRMERRYECTSDFMVEASSCGYVKETAEVSKWLTSYRTRRRLQAHGHEIGFRTNATK